MASASIFAALFVVALMACKSKNPPPAADAAPVASIAAPHPSSSSSSPAATSAKTAPVTVSAIAVSSRVENDSEKPGNLADGELDTAWSSKTGELEGAWVQMLIRPSAGVSIAALHMTVGLTKKSEGGGGGGDGDGDDDAGDHSDPFTQSPRIAEVTLSWAKELDAQLGTFASVEENLVERAKLDTESRALQRIPVPVPIKTPGLLRITVKKVKMGSKLAAREVSISEIELESNTGTRFKSLKPTAAYVGTISDPKPRGILGIVPEKAPPFGCHAIVPTPPNNPRLYCVLGFTTNVANNRGNAGELATLDKSGAKTLGTLVDEDSAFHIPYGLWLRTEKDLKAAQGRPLKGDVKAIPWNGLIEVNGATFRQRETERDPPNAKEGTLFNILNGVLEVKWPGTETFVPIFRAWPGIPPTTMMVANVRALEQAPNLFLVERSMHHASTSTTSRGAEASICDFSTKKCTAYQLPTPETIEEK